MLDERPRLDHRRRHRHRCGNRAGAGRARAPRYRLLAGARCRLTRSQRACPRPQPSSPISPEQSDCAAMVAAAQQRAWADRHRHRQCRRGRERAGRQDRSAEQWQRMIDVNLTGAFFTVQAALADVTRKGAGDAPHRVHCVDRGAERLSLCRRLLRRQAWRCRVWRAPWRSNSRRPASPSMPCAPALPTRHLLATAAAEMRNKTGRTGARRGPRSPRTMRMAG